jgi:hypothetical protein
VQLDGLRLEIPRKQVSILLTAHVVQRLEQQLADAGTAHRPACGGVLLGHKLIEDTFSVRVEDCFPIAPAMRKHAVGRRDVAPDPWLTKQALELWQRDSNARLYAVGQYRVSSTSDNESLPELNIEDFTPRDVLLRLTKHSSQVVLTTHVVDERTRSGDVADLKVPFSELKQVSMKASPASDSRQLARRTSAPFYNGLQRNTGSASEKRPENITPRKRGLAAAFICAAIALLVSVFRFSAAWDWGRISAQASSSMGLQAAKSAAGWDVRWNTRSQLLRHAKRARLIVLDSSVRKEIGIEASDLSAGQILYVPETNDVNLSLELTGQDGRVLSAPIPRVGAQVWHASISNQPDTQRSESLDNLPASTSQALHVRN